MIFEYAALQATLLEFHFTDKDLDDQYPGDDLDMQLVVHAPEFWGNHLVDLCTFDESHTTNLGGDFAKVD